LINLGKNPNPILLLSGNTDLCPGKQIWRIESELENEYGYRRNVEKEYGRER